MRVPWEVHVPDHFFWCSQSQVVSVSSGVSRSSDLCLPLQGLGPGKARPIRDSPFFGIPHPLLLRCLKLLYVN